MDEQRYAELPSEIPPVGNRRIRPKPWKVFATLMVVLLCFGGLSAIVVWGCLIPDIPDPSLYLVVAGLGLGLILPVWFGRLLVREHRILRIGTALLAEIPTVPSEAERWVAAEVAAYYPGATPSKASYAYRYRGQLWQFTKHDEGKNWVISQC